MEVRRAYCSAVDRLVPVVLRTSPVAAGPAGSAASPGADRADPSDLYCLDYKVRCSGWCCPLFSTSDELIQLETRSATPPATRSATPPAEPASAAGRAHRWTRRT